MLGPDDPERLFGALGTYLIVLTYIGMAYSYGLCCGLGTCMIVVAYIVMACDHGLGTCMIVLAYMVMVMAWEHP